MDKKELEEGRWVYFPLGKYKNKGFTLVDVDLLPELQKYPWYLSRKKTNGLSYIQKGILKDTAKNKNKDLRKISLHRFVINAKKGEVVDHINGDTFDNRRCNLRLVTYNQSAQNRKNIKGYHYMLHIKKWVVTIGCFDTEEEAKIARREAEIKYFGEYAPKRDF